MPEQDKSIQEILDFLLGLGSDPGTDPNSDSLLDVADIVFLLNNGGPGVPAGIVIRACDTTGVVNGSVPIFVDVVDAAGRIVNPGTPCGMPLGEPKDALVPVLAVKVYVPRYAGDPAGTLTQSLDNGVHVIRMLFGSVKQASDAIPAKTKSFRPSSMVSPVRSSAPVATSVTFRTTSKSRRLTTSSTNTSMATDSPGPIDETDGDRNTCGAAFTVVAQAVAVNQGSKTANASHVRRHRILIELASHQKALATCFYCFHRIFSLFDIGDKFPQLR